MSDLKTYGNYIQEKTGYNTHALRQILLKRGCPEDRLEDVFRYLYVAVQGGKIKNIKHMYASAVFQKNFIDSLTREKDVKKAHKDSMDSLKSVLGVITGNHEKVR